MSPEIVGPMVGGVVSVTLFLMIGAVLVLRPLSKRLGAYLEILAEQRRVVQPPAPADDSRLLNALESIEQRMARLEERQAFTDALLADRRSAELPGRVEPDFADRFAR